MNNPKEIHWVYCCCLLTIRQKILHIKEPTPKTSKIKFDRLRNEFQAYSWKTRVSQ